MNPTSPTQVCCGEDGAWSPKPGNPVIAACMLCPNSPTYWQRGRKEPYVTAALRNEFGGHAVKSADDA